MLLVDTPLYVWLLVVGINGTGQVVDRVPTLQECLAKHVEVTKNISEDSLMNDIKLDGVACVRAPIKQDPEPQEDTK